MNISVFISAITAEKDAVNAALELAGFGPNNLNVPYRGSTPLEEDQPLDEATRYGCHWWIDRQQLRAIRDIVKMASPTARVVAHVSLEEATQLECERSDLGGYELADAQAGARFFVQIDPALIDDFNRGLNILSLEARGRYTKQIDHPTDPANNWPLLRFRMGDEVAITEAGRPGRLRQVLAALFDAGRLSQADRRPILDLIAVPGQVVNILQLLPPETVWKRLSTREARELGYLNSTTDQLRGE